MFSSNDNVNINIDPSIVSNYHSDESILNCNRPVFNDIIFPYPYSKSQQDNYCPLSSSSSSSFFQFPFIPYTHHGLDIHDDPHNSHQFPQHHPPHDHDLLLLQQQPPPPVPAVDSTGEERITTVPGKKRSLKRDRHSKINTAKGPRDRRMRLSLEVAKQFFGLQDFLGFDKASKTVEWLLIQAKPEIKKLEMAKGTQFQIYSGGAKSNSSTSDCEVVSGIDEAATKESTHKSKRKRIPSNKGKKIRKCREVAVRLHAKDSREKARERARARTREKNQRQKFDESKLCCLIDEANTKNNDINNNNLSNSNEMNQLSSWSSFETAGEESGTQSMQLHDEQLGGNFNQEGEGIVDESYMMGSPSVFNYLPNIGIPVQEHQFQDNQFFCKP